MTKNKFAILVSLLFSLSFLSGVIFATLAHEQKNPINEISFINDLILVTSNAMNSVDTARATYYFIDEHAAIEGVYKVFGRSLPVDLRSTLLHRRTYFADKTVDMLDSSLKIVNNLKPIGKVSQANLELLKNKLTEMEQLAIQLRTIAYKQHLTDNDVNEAQAIVRNMESLAEDIYKLEKNIFSEIIS
jgi:hypothetical protein